MAERNKILEVKDLRVSFRTNEGIVKAVRGVSFDLYEGETLSIVGESGSGKSVSSRTIMGILAGNAIIEEGSILYRGQDLVKLREDQFHEIRGNQIGMIFQDPTSSLNPIMKVGKQITEGMIINGKRKKNKYTSLIHKEKQAVDNLEGNIRELKTNYFYKEKKKKRTKRYNVENKQIKNNLSLSSEERTRLLQENKDALELLKNSKPILSSSQKRTKLKEARHALVLAKKALSLKKKEAKKSIKEEYLKYKNDYKDDLLNAKQKLVEAKTLDAASGETKLATSKAYNDEALELLNKINSAKEELSKYISSINELYPDSTHKEKLVFDEKQKTNQIVYDLKTQYKEKNKQAKKALKEDIPQLVEAKENLAKVKENYRRKFKVTIKEANEEALKIMIEVGITEPEKRLGMYPFQFSGGMKQRIVIAIALTATPEILICDEPTTALDVTIQAQILDLLKKIKRERNLSLIFITHNLGVVANMADRVAVMYAGKIVEYGLSDDIFYNPKHPYTWALLSSMPDLNSSDKLLTIPGTPPNMLYPPKGDAFAQRNKYALKIDLEQEPPMFKIDENHYAATWLLDPRSPKVEPPEVITNRIREIEKAIKLLKKASSRLSILDESKGVTPVGAEIESEKEAPAPKVAKKAKVKEVSKEEVSVVSPDVSDKKADVKEKPTHHLSDERIVTRTLDKYSNQKKGIGRRKK
jgi:oligopeptide transport system ATP-binding protein